jgi:cytochrome P450
MEAFLMEVDSTIRPLAVSRETLEDVEFHGYKMPKGTAVMSNVYVVQYDPNI